MGDFIPWTTIEIIYVRSFWGRICYKFHLPFPYKLNLMTKEMFHDYYFPKYFAKKVSDFETFWELLKDSGSIYNIFVKLDKNGNIIQIKDNNLDIEWAK